MYRSTAVLATVVLVLRAGNAPAQTSHMVDVGPGFVFTPADLVVAIGDTVHWTWIDGFHNVESGLNGDHDDHFRSGDPTDVAGTTYEVTFDQAFLDAHSAPGNTYPYYCMIHVSFNMTGSVTVVGKVVGDGDGDGDVDLDDYAQFSSCVGGPGDPIDVDGTTTHDVSVGPGIVFTPDNLTIEVGDSVHWTWIDGFHNVESGLDGDHDGRFRSGDPTDVSGTTFDVTFDQAFLDANPASGDVYPYYCAVHVGLGMTGNVAVEPVACAAFDLDGDGDVDLADFGPFQRAFTGP